MDQILHHKTQLAGKNYEKRFETWMHILDVSDSVDFDNKCQVQTDYVQEFPFTSDPWVKLAQAYAQKNENDKAYQIYEWGLQMNKSSWKLWDFFCSWVASAYEDPTDIRRVYDSAISCVGKDYFAGELWDKYIEWEEKQGDIEKMNSLFWRLAMLPQKSLENVKNKFKTFIEGVTDLEVALKFAQEMKLVEETQENPEIDAQKSSLITYFEKLTEGAQTHSNNRAQFEDNLPQELYEGNEVSEENKKLWLEYIKYEKSVETEFINF